MGIGASLKALMRGIASLIRTGSWQVEAAADRAVDSTMLAEHMQEAADHDAQQVLSHVNDGLTAFYKLEQDLEAAKRKVEIWTQRAQQAADKYKAATDDGEKAKLRQLGEAAIKEKKKAEAFRDQLQAAYDEAKPDAEEATRAAEEAGFKREDVMSRTEVLRIEDASAQARSKLAHAKQSGGDSEAANLLSEYEARVSEHRAEARAQQTIADVLPRDPGQVADEIDRVTRDGDVAEEFDKLVS